MSSEERYLWPHWLSTERAVIEPAVAGKPLGVARAIICFSRESHFGLLTAFDLLAGEAAPLLPGAVEGRLGDDVAIYQAYFGAAATGMLAEALIASGIRSLVTVGMAGSISPACRIGDLLVPTWGIREEGTSYHYLPPDAPCVVTEKALARMRGYLQGLRFVEGGIWTIDAPYRETMDKVQAYARRGVLAVEMECTALMAITMVRHVDFSAVMVVTDELFGETWVQGFNSDQVMDTGMGLCLALANGFRQELSG